MRLARAGRFGLGIPVGEIVFYFSTPAMGLIQAPLHLVPELSLWAKTAVMVLTTHTH